MPCKRGVWAGLRGVTQCNQDSRIRDFDDVEVAAKLGFTYTLGDALTIGGVYQSAANLPDLKGDGYRVAGFDMPAVGLGFAWRANERLMVAADVKDVMWNSSMNTVTIDDTGGQEPSTFLLAYPASPQSDASCSAFAAASSAAGPAASTATIRAGAAPSRGAFSC